MYKVILHNDDYTPMEFVVEVLIKIFHKTQGIAEQIMMSVHQNGAAVCGLYTYEIAETKVDQVHRVSEQHNYPLRSSLEKNWGNNHVK